MARKNSILFINPDYHCTFLYKDKLRSMGWKADIYVAPEYPTKMLFSEEDIISFKSEKYGLYTARFFYILWLFFKIRRYKYIFFYGRPGKISFSLFPKILGKNIKTLNFFLEIKICKLFNKKIIYLPSGCRDDYSKQSFFKFDNGRVCSNCGIFSVCNDNNNNIYFKLMLKNADLIIGQGFFEKSEFSLLNISWKSIDLELWHPNLAIPERWPKLKKTEKTILILHSTALENRKVDPKNIKGSHALVEAVGKLKNEGFDCQLEIISGVPSNEMKFYQAQADIIVDQLIYGSWGSTTIESLALGKPTICYIRPEWKRFYLETFKLDELPIIEADIDTIYDVLKQLITNTDHLEEISQKSRSFAESMFDVNLNVDKLIAALQTL